MSTSFFKQGQSGARYQQTRQFFSEKCSSIPTSIHSERTFTKSIIKSNHISKHYKRCTNVWNPSDRH